MIPIRITITADKPPFATVRQWRAITKGAHEQQGRYWCRAYLPLHFSPFAGAKYGYKRRTKKYLERKLRAGQGARVEDGGRSDLVYTGRLRRAALAGQDVRGYPTRATIRFAVPSYGTINYRPNRPQLGQELIAVSESERRVLSGLLDKRVQLGIRDLPKPPGVIYE